MTAVYQLFNNYNFQNLRRIQLKLGEDQPDQYFSNDINLIPGVTIEKYSKLTQVYFQDLTPSGQTSNSAAINTVAGLIWIEWITEEEKRHSFSVKPFTRDSSTLVITALGQTRDTDDETEIKSIFSALSSRPVSENLFTLPEANIIIDKLIEKIKSINNSNKKAIVNNNILFNNQVIVNKGVEAKISSIEKGSIDLRDNEQIVVGKIAYSDSGITVRFIPSGNTSVEVKVYTSPPISEYLSLYNALSSLTLVPGSALEIGAIPLPLEACNVKIEKSEFDKAYIDWGQEIKGWIPKIDSCANEIAYIAREAEGFSEFADNVMNIRNAAKALNTTEAWNSKSSIDNILEKYKELVDLISSNDLWKRASADGGHSCETAIKCFTDVMVRRPCLEKETPVENNPAPPTPGEESTEGTTPKCMEVSPERWGVRFRYRDAGGSCSPINSSSDSDIRFDLDAAQQRWPGHTYDWFLMLLPAMRSVIPNSGGMDTPNAMPGLQFQIKSNIAKHRLPGFQPIYQHLGVDTVLVTLVGTFTGDGGLGAKYGNFQEYSGYGTGVNRDVSVNGENEVLPDTRKNENGVSYGALTDSGALGINTISPQYQPWDKREPVSAGFEIGNPMSGHPIVESTNNRVETLMSYNSQTGERVPGLDIKNSRGVSTMEQNLMGAGMFMRDGCPWTCDTADNYQGYREESRGDYAAGYQDALNPDVTNTHSLLEIASYLDSYHEFSSFYKFAVLEGRELEVEINLRRNRDMMQPMPNSFLQYGREATGVGLRNDANGNPSFKGLVKQMEVFHAKSDRTWYTIQIELTDYGMLGQEPLNLTNDLTEAAAAALADQRSALEVNEEAVSESASANLECTNRLRLKSIRFDRGNYRYYISLDSLEGFKIPFVAKQELTEKAEYMSKRETYFFIKSSVSNMRRFERGLIVAYIRQCLNNAKPLGSRPDNLDEGSYTKLTDILLGGAEWGYHNSGWVVKSSNNNREYKNPSSLNLILNQSTGTDFLNALLIYLTKVDINTTSLCEMGGESIDNTTDTSNTSNNQEAAPSSSITSPASPPASRTSTSNSSNTTSNSSNTTSNSSNTTSNSSNTTSNSSNTTSNSSNTNNSGASTSSSDNLTLISDIIRNTRTTRRQALDGFDLFTSVFRGINLNSPSPELPVDNNRYVSLIVNGPNSIGYDRQSGWLIQGTGSNATAINPNNYNASFYKNTFRGGNVNQIKGGLRELLRYIQFITRDRRLSNNIINFSSRLNTSNRNLSSAPAQNINTDSSSLSTNNNNTNRGVTPNH